MCKLQWFCLNLMMIDHALLPKICCCRRCRGRGCGGCCCGGSGVLAETWSGIWGWLYLLNVTRQIACKRKLDENLCSFFHKGANSISICHFLTLLNQPKPAACLRRNMTVVNLSWTTLCGGFQCERCTKSHWLCIHLPSWMICAGPNSWFSRCQSIFPGDSMELRVRELMT